MFDHRKIQRAAIIHNLASEFSGGDGFAIVRDRHDARFAHGSNIGNGFAFAANAGGADGPDADMTVGLGAVNDETGDRSVIVDWFRVGHAADGGEASTSGGQRSRFDSFGIFLARLAQVHMHVNESGSDDEAGGVEYFRTVCFREFASRSDFGDAIAVQQNVAWRQFSMRD